MQEGMNLDVFDSYFDKHVSQTSKKQSAVSEIAPLDEVQERTDPISRALSGKAEALSQDLENILEVCDIHLDEATAAQMQTLPRQQLYVQLPVVSPGTLYKALYELRQSYELYLQLQAQRLLISKRLFPEACKAESSGVLRRPKALYPLLQSWQAEAAPCANVTDTGFFFSYSEAAYLGLGKELFSQTQQSKQQNGIITPPPQLRNAHPLQALVSLLEKYPEMVLLLGQRLPSVTQRLGLYQGYIKQLSLRFVGTTPAEIRVQSVQIEHKEPLNVLPPNSLSRTHFARAVFAGVLKSLITHEGPIQAWPSSYFYQPASGQVKTLFLSDFLRAIAWDPTALQWARSVCLDAVQQLHGERTFDLFRLTCGGNAEAAHFLAPVTQILLRRIQANIPGLPDILKTVLSIGYFILKNLFGNVAEKLYAADESNQLAKALKARFYYIAEAVDLGDRRRTAEALGEIINGAFQRFAEVFLVGTVLHTTMTNPVAAGIISPEQAGFADGAVFVSNLAFLADLVVASMGSLGADDQNPIAYQLRLFNRQSGGAQAAEFFEQSSAYEQNLQVQVQAITGMVRPTASVVREALQPQNLCYQLDREAIKCIVQTQEISHQQLTGGFWMGTSGYFAWLARSFMEHCDYLIQNAEVLQRNCRDVLQQVIELPELSDLYQQAHGKQNQSATGGNESDRFWQEHQAMFSNDVEFALFDGLSDDINAARRLVTEEAVQKFLRLSENEPVCFVPYFNNVGEVLQSYQTMGSKSACLELYERHFKQAQQESESFWTTSISENKAAVSAVSEQTKTYFTHCDQVAELFYLLEKLKKFRRQIDLLQSSDEAHYFSEISRFQAEYGALEAEAREAILAINQHTDEIQQRKEERAVLDQLKLTLQSTCDALSQGKREKQCETYNPDAAQFNLFEELEAEFRRSRTRLQFDELVFNHNKRVQALYGEQRQFVPAGTLERLFERQVAFQAPGSAILNKLFGGPSGIMFQDSFRSRE